MPTLEEIARSMGFSPAVRIDGGSPEYAIDLWRCSICYGIVLFGDIPDHKGWHGTTGTEKVQ